MRFPITALIVLAVFSNCISPAIAADPVVRPKARAQTDPVPHGADAADDPAIWLHPTDPSQSLILGTDKQGGIVVYDIDGRLRQIVSPDCLPDNIDVLYGVPLNGAKLDIAVASTRGRGCLGAKIWRIDPNTRKLTDITAGKAIPAFGNTEPYGICTYQSHRTGKHYYFINNRAGHVEQYVIEPAGERLTGRKVRSFRVGSIVEGCVADDELGDFYIAAETVGIWKFDAEPDGSAKGKLIARVGEHGLKRDIEGLTIYTAAGGKGYLLASSQGSSTFNVYSREGDNHFICTIDPAPGAIDDVNDTDGIAVINLPTSRLFPKGLFIVQDGSNAGGNQNFKMYGWEDIAGDRLLIDTTHDSRKMAPMPQAAFPVRTWEYRRPEGVGLSRQKLDALRDLVGGRGCVVRHGYMVYAWGDQRKSGDVASAMKPVISTLLLMAIQDKRIGGADEKIVRFEPRLRDINHGKDANITWRHLASQTSGYGLTERPGQAYSYNDFALALYYDTLMKVYGQSGTVVLKAKLADPLGFEDPFTFEAFGPKDRPGRLAVSVRDFARFGLMWLRGGRWGDRQLVDPDLLQMAISSPIPADTPLTSGKEAAMLPGQRSIGGTRNITPVGPGYYNFNWWLNRTDKSGRRLFVDAPADTYVASGHGGVRMLWIIPSLDLVVSWNDAKVDDHDASPGNPNSKCNRAARLIREACELPSTAGGWVKYADNPVMGGKYGTCFDISVLKDDQVYRMWLSWRPKQSVALVESKDGIHWSEPPRIVLGPSRETGWEDDINRPVVVKRADGYHMWYTGQAKGRSSIGYATSPDGIVWKRMSDKPVLVAERPWEKVAVMCPHVLWDERAKLFRMWYSAGEQYEPDAVGYATSPDGLHWTKYESNPVFKPDPASPWEKHKVTGVQVIPQKDGYLMFYIGFRDTDHAQIGVARSPDGIGQWQRHPANPIIRTGQNQWDHDACYKPFAIFDGKRWLLWYNGRRGGLEQIGVVFHDGEDLGFPPPGREGSHHP